MDKIRKLILNRCTEILSTEFDKQDETEFLDLLNSTLVGKENLLNLSNSYMLLGLMCVYNSEENFNELKEQVELIKEDFDKIDELGSFLAHYFNILDAFTEKKLLCEFMKYDKVNKEIIKMASDKLSELKITEKELKAFIYAFYRINNQIFSTIEARNTFLDIYIRYFETDLTIDINRFLAYKCQPTEVEFADVEEAELPRNLKRMINKSINNHINKGINIHQISMMISERARTLVLKRDKFFKNNKKKAIAYQKLLQTLEKEYKKDFMTITSEMERSIDDAEIKYEVYLCAINHNLSSYNKIVEENNNNKVNKITKLEQLLLNNNIKINFLNSSQKEQIVNKRTLEELEQIIEKIKLIGYNKLICSQRDLFNLLMYGNIEQISQIIEYIKRGILNLEFVINDFSILLENQDCNSYAILLNNINLFLDHKLDVEDISIKNPELLTFNNFELKKNVGLVDAYNLNFRDCKNTKTRYDIYGQNKLFDLLDLFIEVGSYEYIKKNCSMLENSSFNIIKRIQVAQSINMNVDNNLSPSLITGKNFYVADQCLDEYIEDYSDDYIDYSCSNLLYKSDRNELIDFNNYMIELLDNKYKISDLEYVINGIKISRLKVLRNLHVLLNNIELDDFDVLFNAIIFNTMLTSEQYELIKEAIFLLKPKLKKM